jgi:hypothetical protein
MLRWPVSASVMYVVVAGLLLAALLGRVRERATVQGLAAIGLSAVVLSGSMLSTGPWTTSPSTPRVTEPAGPHPGGQGPRSTPLPPYAASSTRSRSSSTPRRQAAWRCWRHDSGPRLDQQPARRRLRGAVGTRADPARTLQWVGGQQSRLPPLRHGKGRQTVPVHASAPLTRQRHGRADWMDCHPGLATRCELWHNHGEHPVFDAGMHHLQCRRRGQRDRPAKRSTGSFQPVKPLAVWTGRKVTGTADHQQATREGNVQIARLDPGNVDPHQECVPGLKQVQRRPRDRTGRPAGVGHGRLGHVANQDRQYLRLLIHAMSHLYRERVDPEHPHRARA